MSLARETANADPLASLRELYAETDQALAGWTCERSTDCCHFARTGREPYLWPIEWKMIERALAGGGRRRSRPALRALPVAEEDGACPLLDGSGRCTVYEARPFGCRTFFCERATGPERRPPRHPMAEIGRRLATLAEREDPRAGGPRPLSRWLDSRDKKR